jgi:hypothetical protein
MTEKSKSGQPTDQPAERTATIKPAEKAVADSHDRGQLMDKQREAKAYEESPTRPPREKVSGLFGKQHLSHVHRMEKGETLKSVVQGRNSKLHEGDGAHKRLQGSCRNSAGECNSISG